MRKSGQITVFLSLILILICGLVCGMLESVRSAGARCYVQTAADSAVDSVFSQYHRQLWEQYRIAAYEYSSDRQTKEELGRYLDMYLSAENFYPLSSQEIRISGRQPLTGGDGELLKQEILEYMKYGIWNIETDEEILTDTRDGIKEALAVSTVAKAYGSHAQEAVRLEESLENISDSLNRQKQLFQEASDCLSAWDGDGFLRKAKELIGELDHIPGLTVEYERQADLLARALEETGKTTELPKQEIRDPVIQTVNSDLTCYEAYIKTDGERRREIAALPAQAKQNRSLVKEVMEEAARVERIIEEWDEDDDDGPDEEELWRPVIRAFNRFQLSSLGCPLGIRDHKREKRLEDINRLIETGLLKLVLPEDTVLSEGILNLEEFPSTEYREENHEEYPVRLPEQIVISEYCSVFLTDFLADGEKEVLYELEYLLAGKDTDQENLKEAVTQIFLMRSGLNLIHLLSDPEKRSEAKALAASIVGAAGLLPLVDIMEIFILGVWAEGEALVDVRTMLEGGNVPFLKSRESWNLELETLFTSDFWTGTESRSQSGMRYGEYIKLLLLIGRPQDKYYRIMDVIQMNLKRAQPGFYMKYCLYSMKTKMTVKAKRVFTSLSPIKSLTTPLEERYQITVGAGKAY